MKWNTWDHLVRTVLYFLNILFNVLISFCLTKASDFFKQQILFPVFSFRNNLSVHFTTFLLLFRIFRDSRMWSASCILFLESRHLSKLLSRRINRSTSRELRASLVVELSSCYWSKSLIKMHSWPLSSFWRLRNLSFFESSVGIKFISQYQMTSNYISIVGTFNYVPCVNVNFISMNIAPSQSTLPRIMLLWKIFEKKSAFGFHASTVLRIFQVESFSGLSLELGVFDSWSF